MTLSITHNFHLDQARQASPHDHVARWRIAAAHKLVSGISACETVLKPVAARYQGKVARIYFRADAGFANPDVYEFLEASGSSLRSGFRPTGLQDWLLAQEAGRTTLERRATVDANFTY